MGFHSMATQEHDFQIKIHIFHNKQNKIEREMGIEELILW